MKDMRKQRAVYAAVLTLVLAVTMGISLYTASSGSSEENSDQGSGYTASLPEEIEKIEPAIPDTTEVQQSVQTPNDNIEGTEGSESQPEESSSEPEESTDGSVEIIPEDLLYMSALDAPSEADQEANGIFFDPATDMMAWPVSGNVVMEYSLDSVIYDATLDQFRVNDSVSISAEANETVTAAASGIVAEIGYTQELGNYVVLEHGNGFRTTYGQLDDNIPVTVAQRVERGEAIGQLTEPVWHCIALGDHVDFKVTMDGEPVDPLIYLEYEME